MAGVHGLQAAPSAPRLSGSFVQYQEEMMGWDPALWRQVLDSMKALKMNTVIIQMLAAENADGTTHSFIVPGGGEDATQTILDYADTNGFKVFIGLYLHQYRWEMDSNFLAKALADNVGVARQAWQRYMVPARHPSFAGWYAPLEPWTADWPAAQIAGLRTFYKGIHDACNLLSGEAPLAIAPSISADRPPPCQVQQLYLQLLGGSGIGIVMLQDSVGAQQWTSDIPQRNTAYFQAFQTACRARGVRLWADVETFDITPSHWLACDVDRLRQQLEAAAPWVEQMVTFDFFHYLNPVAFLSSWDTARRVSMAKLYADYKADFVDADYTPFAPQPAATLAGEVLTLAWRGIPGDPFQAQYKNNLTDPEWVPLAVPVVANGTRFSVVDASPGRPARFYRVGMLPRPRVPDSFVWIPPGSFWMGTPADDPASASDPLDTQAELTSFPVTLTNGFWIGGHELTQWEYQNVMCANPSTFTDDLDHPVETLSWIQATNYCARLTQQERRAGRLPAPYVYRLPTEAEWEYAARGGATNCYSFGNAPASLADYAWYGTNSGGNTHAVGQRRPNPWGLADASGNVREWCYDWIP